jgi:2'-5' RNA ligase
MPLAVTLRAAESEAAPLLALQDEVAAFAAASAMRELGYWPHVTLAIYEHFPARELRALTGQLFDGAVAIELVFEAVRWFEGPSLTLYAAPAPSRALEELVRKLNRLIPPERCHPHYRPGCYIPHCTLATMIGPDAREGAITFVRRKRIGFRVAFTQGEVVSFPPPQLEARWPLPGSAPRR